MVRAKVLQLSVNAVPEVGLRIGELYSYLRDFGAEHYPKWASGACSEASAVSMAGDGAILRHRKVLLWHTLPFPQRHFRTTNQKHKQDTRVLVVMSCARHEKSKLKRELLLRLPKFDGGEYRTCRQGLENAERRSCDTFAQICEVWSCQPMQVYTVHRAACPTF
jgi:hypothetical protein